MLSKEEVEKNLNSVYNIKYKTILIIKRKEMSKMNTLGWITTVIVCAYIAVRFGKIAGKHGKNSITFWDPIYYFADKPDYFRLLGILRF